MKITFVAVSVPALRQVLHFKTKYEKECQEHEIEIACFYVAGMEQRYLLKPHILIDAIRQSDAPDASYGTDDRKCTFFWNHKGHEKCISADRLLAAGNRNRHAVFFCPASAPLWRAEMAAKRTPMHNALRNLSERSIFAGVHGYGGRILEKNRI